jgi:asparagine synthase (glutamine-hydrolysing)
MCGIAGVLTNRPDLDLPVVLARMQGALEHRGPDDQGCLEQALPQGFRLGLAQTRLAIIDTSAGGHQPMVDRHSDSVIAYNGEVYNHQTVRRQLPLTSFSSTSDTETLLRGWVEKGAQLLSSLRGMFAFALYDGRRQQFWLVRDRLGIKPLYVSQVGPGTWLFASEVRALLASGLVARHLNGAALESYLAFGAVPAPWTLVEGVVSLMPGEYWVYDLAKDASELQPKQVRYWRPPFAMSKAACRRREEVIEELRPVLAEAIGLRMVADVPVGVFLSGGIDSSAVVGTLAALGYRVRTFSVVFGESEYDESQYSRLVAHYFRTKHQELVLQPSQVLLQFQEANGAYDQPSIDGLNTYFVAQATRAAGVKVALSGLGGDELFAGYRHFRLLTRLQSSLCRRGARFLYSFWQWSNPQGIRTTKLRALLDNHPSFLSSYAVLRQVMGPEIRRQLFQFAGHDPVPLPEEGCRALEETARGLDAANATSLCELSLYLANMLLRDTDQMSMAHGLEVREPLLDFLLVEAVARIPGPFKLARGRNSATKGLLVDALPVMLPKPVVRRSKMGFVFPWERWLRHDLRGQIEDTLFHAPTLKAAGLRPAQVRTLWDGYLSSKPGLRYTDVLCLHNLLYWVKQHRLELPAAAPPPSAQPTPAVISQ